MLKNIIVKIVAAAAVLIAIGFIGLNYSNTMGGKTISAKIAGEKAINFINENLLTGKGQASLKDVLEESGLYKIKFLYQEEVQEIYITRDGKYIFPIMEGIPIDLDKATAKNNQEQNLE